MSSVRPDDVPYRQIVTPDELLEELAYAGARERVSEGCRLVKVAIVTVAGQALALPGDYVRYVTRSKGISPVPGCEAHILGLLELGSSLIGVVDTGRLLALDRAADFVSDYVVVVEIDGERIGLAVSSIEDVVELPADEIRQVDTSARSFVAAELVYKGQGIPLLDWHEMATRLLGGDVR